MSFELYSTVGTLRNSLIMRSYPEKLRNVLIMIYLLQYQITGDGKELGIFLL